MDLLNQEWSCRLYNNGFFNGGTNGISISFWLQNLQLFGTLNILTILGLGATVQFYNHADNVGESLTDPMVIGEVLYSLNQLQIADEVALSHLDDGDNRFLGLHVRIMLYDRWRRIFTSPERSEYIEAMNTGGPGGTPLWEVSMEPNVVGELDIQRLAHQALAEESRQANLAFFTIREDMVRSTSFSTIIQQQDLSYRRVDNEEFPYSDVEVSRSQSAPPSICSRDPIPIPICAICKEHKKDRSFALLPCCGRVGSSNNIHLICVAKCAVNSNVGAGKFVCPFCRTTVEIKSINEHLDARDISEEEAQNLESDWGNPDAPCTSAQAQERMRMARPIISANGVSQTPHIHIVNNQGHSNEPAQHRLGAWDPVQFLAIVPSSSARSFARGRGIPDEQFDNGEINVAPAKKPRQNESEDDD